MIIVALSEKYEALIRKYAAENALSPSLVAAVCMQESGFEPDRPRYEPKWLYLYLPSVYAHKLRITDETEIQLQKFSWGMMQVMGSVARELGYDNHLQKLSGAELGILFGCKKLGSLTKKYADTRDVVSSYNQGMPLKDSTGKYKNEAYVNAVLNYKTTYLYLDI